MIGMSLLYDGTLESMAEIAEFICEQFAGGATTGKITLNGVAFDMDAVAMCSYFVQRCAWVACGHDIPADFGGTARATEEDMIAAHIGIQRPGFRQAIAARRNFFPFLRITSLTIR